jgi:hypothetical protein
MARKKGFWGGRRRDSRLGFEILSEHAGIGAKGPAQSTPAAPTRTAKPAPAPEAAAKAKPLDTRNVAATAASKLEDEKKAVALKRTPRQFIYEWLVRRNTFGGTDEEIQIALHLDAGTARARRVELVRMKLIVDSGTKRKTRSGRPARVWRATSVKAPPTL